MDYNSLFSTPMDLTIFLEPRGFMRFLQLISSVLAFAAIKGYEGFVVVKYCQGLKARLNFYYPFNFNDVQLTTPANCTNNSSTNFISLSGDFSLEAELFVTCCVLSFLFCLVIIYVYVKLTPQYESNSRWPSADFLISVALSGLWIFFFVMWIKAVSGIKEATDSARVSKECITALRCEAGINGSYFGLNLSVGLGLINLILWTSNLWFLFKETPWFGTNTGVAFRSSGQSV